jgi:adenylate cyclase
MRPAQFAHWRAGETERRLWPWALLNPLLIGAAVAALALSPVGQALEQRIGSWVLFRVRGPLPPPPEVVIVAMRRDAGERIWTLRDPPAEHPCADLRIDHAPSSTHSAMGNVPERWGRCHYVELMRRLALVRPAVIALDVVFQPRADRPPGEDRELGRAINAAGPVVAAQALRVRKQADAGTEGTAESIRTDFLVALSRDVADALLGAAPMPLPKDGSNRIDQFWTFKEHGWVTPSLAALALQAYLLDAYPAFAGEVGAASPQLATELPDLAGGGRARPFLQTHMVLLRRLLASDPVLASRVGDRLHEGATLRSHVAALAALYLAPAERRLNLFGPAGTIRTLDITQLLATPPEAFASDPFGMRGRAVFIGYAEDVEWDERENFSTVYDRGAERLSGVEITATAFANLLSRTDLRSSPAAVQGAIAFAVAFGSAVLCYAFATSLGLALAAAGTAGYLLLAAGLFARHHFCLPVFLPGAAAAPLGAVVALGHKYVIFRQDRAALRFILEQLVPREVVDLFRQNARHLEAVRENVNAACVMTDVEGYTSLSNRLSPSQVSTLLGEYFAAIFRPVAAHGGFVSDLKGDSILAVWTDRTRNGAVRAQVCAACLELQQTVETFNLAHPETPLPTRIGVSYGDVVVGAIGAPGHIEYRAVGDTVNTASRVEQLSKVLGTRLLVTEALIQGVSGFLTRRLGEFELRGRRTPAAVYELIAREELATPEQRVLCSDFEAALRVLSDRQVSEASTRFKAILEKHPGDGPSRYYLGMLAEGT